MSQHNPIDFVENEFNYIHYKDDSFHDNSLRTVVDKFYSDYNADIIKLDRKQLRHDVMKFAIFVFEQYGSIQGYIYYQLEHAYLTKYARRFLIDTYQFIITGKRDIAIESWQYLLHESVKLNERIRCSELLPDERERMDKLEEYDNPRPYELAEWLKHNYGLQDLIWSLKILFGTNNQQEVIY